MTPPYWLRPADPCPVCAGRLSWQDGDTRRCGTCTPSPLVERAQQDGWPIDAPGWPAAWVVLDAKPDDWYEMEVTDGS